jgi:ParB family chromosome partitioning protein
MLNKKKVLGRGLGALIGDAGRAGRTGAPGGAGEKTGEEGRFILCPISDISPNRLQPRKSFDEAALKGLSDSIKEKGVIEPVVVRRNSGGYELIAGERRWRAAKMAGFGEVPAVIADVSDEESLEFAIIENIQREDLNAIEEAEAYRSLVNFGLTQEEVARKVGKERATVANYLRLLKLPPEVKDELSSGRISMGHARAILSIEGHAAQANLCRSIIRKGLSVREAEALSQRGGTPKKARTRDAAISPLEDALREKFGTKVLVKDKGGKGRIEILYYSAEERERIIELLKA